MHLGDHRLQKGPEQERDVAQSIQHPCYDGNSDERKHDLMLVRLCGPASLGNKVRPINLTDHCPQAGQKCTISGWGTVSSPQGSGKEGGVDGPRGPQTVGKTLPLEGDKEEMVAAGLRFTSGPC